MQFPILFRLYIYSTGNIYRDLNIRRQKMNLNYRKLEMLEQDLIAKEEAAKIEGMYTCPIDSELKEKVSLVLDQVRYNNY